MQESKRRVSGRQLTVMVVAVCAAVVLAPVGVFAASHSVISIADAKHPSRTATVTKGGAQVVGGSVKVHGTVRNARQLPGTPYTVSTANAGGALPTVPKGKHFVVTTINVSVSVSPGARPQPLIQYDGTSKSMLVPVIDQGDFNGFEYFENVLPVYFIADPGTEMSIVSQPSAGTQDSAFVTFYGYLV